MRLGGWFGAENIDQLDALGAKLDAHGLSAINAPNVLKMTDDECAAFGEKARKLGMVIGETGFWQNLLTPDKALRQQRIDTVREMLHKCQIMGCRSLATLIGTRHESDHPLAAHAYNFTESCRREMREVVLRVLDGLELTTTRHGLEPWCNTFFYQPEDIAAFIESVGHPALGVHLDQMNMVSHRDFFHTTALIHRTFDLLSKHVVSVHLKDIQWDHRHMFLKWDEVLIGEGVMDYDTYLRRLSQLPADMSCYCEHLPDEATYADNFRRLHAAAARVGLRFLGRGERA